MPDPTAGPTTPATNNTNAGTPGTSTSTAAPAAAPTSLMGGTAAPADPAKPAEPGAAPAADPAKPAEPAKTSAPEKYDLKMPEGVSPDTKLLEGFEPLAREMGLSNEAAQKMVDLYAKHVDAQQKAAQADLDRQRSEWVAQVQKDPKHGETLSMAKRGLEAVATDEAKKLINETWLGDHPALIATFAKIGRMLAEHPIHSGNGAPKPDKRSPEEVLYPGMTSKS